MPAQHYDADSAAGLLVTTADLLAFCGVTPGFGNRGEQLALHILKEHLEYIYNHLSSGSNPKVLNEMGEDVCVRCKHLTFADENTLHPSVSDIGGAGGAGADCADGAGRAGGDDPRL